MIWYVIIVLCYRAVWRAVCDVLRVCGLRGVIACCCWCVLYCVVVM